MSITEHGNRETSAAQTLKQEETRIAGGWDVKREKDREKGQCLVEIKQSLYS